MKTRLTILPAIALAVLLVGCKTQKAATKAAKSEILHERALQAFEERKFVIEAKEFFFPDNKAPFDYAYSGYISLNDSHAVVQFFPVILSLPSFNSTLSNDNLEDVSAILIREKTKRNGDVLYSMKVQGDAYWKNKKILITLYGNSNLCHVQVDGAYAGYNIVSFNGYAYPLND